MNSTTMGDLKASVVKQKTSPDSPLKLTVTGSSKSVDQLDTDVSIVIPSAITKNLKPVQQKQNLDFVTVVYKNGDMLGSDGQQTPTGW